jgi:Uncharacterized low-complexity proteins
MVEIPNDDDVSLSEINRGADLGDADLSGAVFIRTDFSGVDLSDASLHGAIFREADLSGANLVGANLTGAVLSTPTSLVPTSPAQPLVMLC